MTIFLKSDTTLDRDRSEEAWQVYRTALERLQEIAIQQQVMSEEDFAELMADESFEKIMLVDSDGNMVGLSCSTRDLDKISLVSSRYLQKHYPEAYADGRLWYIPFVAVPDGDEGAFTMIIDHVFDQATKVDGVVGFDACDFNVYSRGFARAIEVWTIRLSLGQCSADYLGAEHYFAFDVNGAYGEKGRRLPREMGKRR